MVSVNYMDLEKLYYEVENYIKTVDFSSIWRGFEPLNFALYTDHECFFNGKYIEKTDDFLANTSILYNGEWIAIWHVQEEIDPIVLSSKIIHEMFHGFQQQHNEPRFVDELEALYKYKYIEENLSLKLKENQLLYSLLTKFDKNIFEEFLQIRKQRSESFRYEYHYESCIEQIEGAANYVELNCLKQLSENLFREKLSAMSMRIIDQNNLIPIRIICYDIGALLLFVMSENDITFEYGFSNISFSEYILNGVAGKKCIPELKTKELIDSFNERSDEIITNAIKKNDIVYEKSCELLGVNVYNAIYYNNHIISRYFVMFGAEDSSNIEYGDFVIETSGYKTVTKIYRI